MEKVYKNMKAAKKILRGLIIFHTSTWGIIFGIFVPCVIMLGELDISPHYIMKVWVVMAILGYIIPCFLVMIDCAKIAAAFSVVGTGMVLYIHSVMTGMNNPGEDGGTGASFMYLPQIFMIVLTVLYIFVVYSMKERRADKHNAPAPSILEKN